MGVFTIRGTIIGMITDILVDARIYWENEGLVFLQLVEPICYKMGILGILMPEK